MISAKLCVPAGTWVHLSSGDGDRWVGAVYLSGITPPSSHAVDVIVRRGPVCPARVRPAGRGACRGR